MDDASIGVARLARASNAAQADHGHLMVGGVAGADMADAVQRLAGVRQSLTGCISDVAFNDRLLDLHQVSFSFFFRVAILLDR